MFSIFIHGDQTDNYRPIPGQNKQICAGGSLNQGPVSMEVAFGSGSVATRSGAAVVDGEKFASVSFFSHPFEKKPGESFTEEELAVLSSLKYVPAPVRFIFPDRESLEAVVKNLQNTLKEWDELK